MKSRRRLSVGFGLTVFLTLGAGPAAAQTTLMWTQYTDWPDFATWEGAIEKAADHSEGGFTDWRMPTLEELQAAAQDGSVGEYHESFRFTGTNSLWSSTGVGRWGWWVMVSWVDGESVPSAGEASKVWKANFSRVKYVRDASVCGVPADCDDDGDPCTSVDCVGGACVSEVLDCDDGNACTTDGCAGGVCFNDTIDCDDGDACSVDNCDVNSGCLNTFPACGLEDGCCGPDCDPTNDPDCPCGAHNEPCIFHEDCCSLLCRLPSNKCSKF